MASERLVRHQSCPVIEKYSKKNKLRPRFVPIGANSIMLVICSNFQPQFSRDLTQFILHQLCQIDICINLTKGDFFVVYDLPNVKTFEAPRRLFEKWSSLISIAVMCEGSFNGMSSSRDVMGSIQPDPGPIAGGRESPDQFLENRVKPLHVAALVLAIAALISVLAACYVITRSGNFYHFAPTAMSLARESREKLLLRATAREVSDLT